MRKYFGTDGIRGKSFTFLNSEKAFKIGMSLKEVYNASEIVIGLDTRDSSYMLAHMIAAGANSVGINVLYAGLVSTPMIAHYSKIKEIVGIMITASHNPYTDNGIKIFNNGNKSKEDEELIIESYIDSNKIIKNELFGTFTLTEDIKVEYLKVIEKLNLSKSNLKVAYDSANGANYLIAKEVFDKYFPNSYQINSSPNGKNINLNCGSTHLDSIIDFVKTNNMDLGFAYDGDGDRLLMVDSDGLIYDGDFINYFIAKYLKNKGELKNNKIALTKMTNPGILKALKENNIEYILTEVGDKYVFEQMVLNDLSLGGEASGHIILKNLLDTGDGLLASLYILKLLEEENLNLSKLREEIKLYPLNLVNIKNINKDVLKLEEVNNKLNKLKENFKENELFYIRPSGTEDLLRVTLSMEDEKELDKYMDIIVKYLKEMGNF